MKIIILFVCLLATGFGAGAQTGVFNNLQINDNIRMKGRTVNGISDDSSVASKDPLKLITERAAKIYADSIKPDISTKVDKTTTVNEKPLSSNVTLTKNDFSDLNLVDNTPDISKPISTAMQNAFNLKANNDSVLHLTGSETATGTKTFNNSFQTNSSTLSYWGNGLAYGFLSWDGGTGRAIIGALPGKILSLVTGASGTEALGLDQSGNAVIRGTASASPASDSAKLAQLGQIYPSTKKWVIFGDSFSADDSKYWGTVRDRLKLTGIVTNAVSGNTIYQQSTKLDSILTANPTYFNLFDICSILIGINDFAGSNPLGTISDTAGQPTYAGYLKHMIEAILTAKPTIELYVLTPPEANGAGVSYKATNSAGWTVQQMSVLISQICYSYSVQCIDLYAYSQFNLKTIPTLTLDGLHPNAAGSKFLGNMVAAAIVNRQSFGKYIGGLNDATSRDSSTTHSLSIKNNWKINNDGTAFFGNNGTYYGMIKWDTITGGVQHRAIFGADLGATILSLFVDGNERATLDSNGNFLLYEGGAFRYQQHIAFTAADSLAAPDKKYVDDLWKNGTATLASGTVTVSTPLVKTGAKIFVSVNTPSGTQGFLSAPTSSIVDETSFVINSSSAADNSTVNWQIINP